MTIVNKFKNIPKGMKASIAFFTASLVSKGISYISTPIYTRLLTSAEYGIVSVFMTWLDFFSIIALFGLNNGVFNNGMIDYPDKRNEYTLSMLMLSNIITFVFSVLIIGLYPFYNKWINFEFPFALLMCIIFFLKPAYNFWIARQRYEYQYKSVFISTVISAVASPVTAIILIKNLDNHIYARIFGAEIPLLLIYLGFYIYIGCGNNWKVNTYYWKESLLFNLPLLPHYISAYLLSSSDKLMISFLAGNTATAYYSVSYAISAVVFMVWNAANASLIPYTYEKCKKKEYESISKVTLPVLFVFSLACFLIIMLAPEALIMLTTSEYKEAMYVIPPIVGGVFFQAQYDMYANILYYFKRPKYVMFSSIFSCLINIVLNYIFIKKYGYIAAGYTTLFSYLIQAFFDYLGMKRIVGERVYNVKYIVVLSFIVIVTCLFAGALYQHIIIRYFIILLLLSFVILGKKRIIKSLRW